MEAWLNAHIHAFEYWEGAPSLAIPDNTKTGVTKACRYDPDLNPTCQNLAAHYGFGVLPARPYKPRDKAVVKNAVQGSQRWIIAALRHRKSLLPGGGQPSHPGTAGASQPPALPQARGKPCERLRRPGQAGAEAVIGRSFRPE
jgi:transposase